MDNPTLASLVRRRAYWAKWVHKIMDSSMIDKQGRLSDHQLLVVAALEPYIARLDREIADIERLIARAEDIPPG